MPHLDLLATFSNLPPARLVVNAHDAHPNDYAHALTADAVDEFLKQEITKRTDPDVKAPLVVEPLSHYLFSFESAAAISSH